MNTYRRPVLFGKPALVLVSLFLAALLLPTNGVATERYDVTFEELDTECQTGVREASTYWLANLATPSEETRQNGWDMISARCGSMDVFPKYNENLPAVPIPPEFMEAFPAASHIEINGDGTGSCDTGTRYCMEALAGTCELLPKFT